MVVSGVYVLPEPLALARATVDRAALRRADPAWQDAAWARPETRVLVVGGGKIAADGDGLRFVSSAEAPDGDRYLLGVEDGLVYFAVGVVDAPAESVTLREAGPVLGDRDAGLAVHAMALANWHATHRHCGRCGSLTRVEPGGHLRTCPVDGAEQYPRTDPAVIVLVVDDQERCLLGRATAWPPRRFSTLAGFVEPGETPERAVVREVHEETGVVVTSCRYVGAQPWPFPSSLMLGYYGTAAGEPPVPDGDEIAEARWFSRAELAEAVVSGAVSLPGPVSIAHRLLEGWFGAPLPPSPTPWK